MIKPVKLLSLKDLNDSEKKFVDSYMNEPVAFTMPALGWKVVIFIPKENSSDITVDVIPIQEWGFFSSFRYPDKIENGIAKYPALLRAAEHPIIPQDYIGSLSPYFSYLTENYPSWNRIPPLPLILGCISPNDKRPFDEIKTVAVSIYNDMNATLSKLENGNITKTLEDLLGILVPPPPPNKEKLN